LIYIDSDLYHNDPGTFPEVITNEISTYFMQYDPCQPLPWELPTKCFISQDIALRGHDKEFMYQNQGNIMVKKFKIKNKNIMVLILK